MSRTLAFEMIQDTRFSKTPKGDVSKWAKKILSKLNKIDGVSAKAYGTRRIDFGDGVISYRKSMHVNKEGRNVTWNDIYGIVNSVNAPYYKFI